MQLGAPVMVSGGQEVVESGGQWRRQTTTLEVDIGPDLQSARGQASGSGQAAGGVTQGQADDNLACAACDACRDGVEMSWQCCRWLYLMMVIGSQAMVR